MPILRNRLSSARSGGPRQFAELRDKMMISPQSDEMVDDLKSELDNLDLRGRELRNVPVVIAEPRNGIETVLERFRDAELDNVRVRQAVDEVRENSDDVMETTSSIVEATTNILISIGDLPSVSAVNFVRTYADFGPENLRFSPTEMETLSTDDLEGESGTLEELNENINIREAWSQTRGEDTAVAIFDTGFDENMFDQSRIVGTFSGSDVDGVHAPEEGHGTMCAGASVANVDDGVPFNGSAPDAGVILVRNTDNEGQIRTDIISEAWDWIMDLDLDRPIISNHSYGTPLCTGRPRAQFCETPDIDAIKIANSSPWMTSVYAAGNEAMQCGHRPSGITNAITGGNSIAEVITVGALRFDMRDAQRYSSHGRGDCAPIADPKPNVSCALPNKAYYGVEDGWKIKDMSTGIGGSSGGTSHASPTTAGMIALLQSKAMQERDEPMQTEEIKQIIHTASDPPRRTQINIFDGFVGKDGYDARFGHGQINIVEALNMV